MNIILVVCLFFLGLLLFGCVSDTSCPSNYIVEKTDRVRCYDLYNEVKTRDLACQQMDIMKSIFPFDENIGRDMNCSEPRKVIKYEVDCPLSCVQSISAGSD